MAKPTVLTKRIAVETATITQTTTKRVAVETATITETTTKRVGTVPAPA